MKQKPARVGYSGKRGLCQRVCSASNIYIPGVQIRRWALSQGLRHLQNKPQYIIFVCCYYTDECWRRITDFGILAANFEMKGIKLTKPSAGFRMERKASARDHYKWEIRRKKARWICTVSSFIQNKFCSSGPTGKLSVNKLLSSRYKETSGKETSQPNNK